MKQGIVVIIFLLGLGVGTLFNEPLWSEAEQQNDKVHIFWYRVGGCYVLYKDSIAIIDANSKDNCLKTGKPLSFDPFEIIKSGK